MSCGMLGVTVYECYKCYSTHRVEEQCDRRHFSGKWSFLLILIFSKGLSHTKALTTGEAASLDYW